MSERRTVRTTSSFEDDLHRQLRDERGPNGEPSVADFEAVELPEIIEEFAVDLDKVPPLIRGRSDYRLLIKTGVLFRAISVTAQLVSDGSVELLQLGIDTGQAWD